jgi:Bifunctional DNA primase/polymerase, N-terminal/AAA domain/Primase C terminal 1 (PriCT-1)
MRTPAQTRMLDAVLLYAEYGVPVFPVWGVVDGQCACGKADCQNPGKHPLGAAVPNGVKDATADPATIRAWWTRFPLANIATPTSWTSVLDVDPRNGGDETLAELERQHGPLPETAEVLTGGGGRHIYFEPVPGLGPSAGKVGPGLDIKAGPNAYVLLPPSSHMSGRHYCDEVEHPLFETPLAPMRDWLLRPASAPTSSNGDGATAATDWATLLTGAPEGQRHDAAVRIAGHYLGKRLPPDEVEQIMAPWVARCVPPYDLADVRRIVRDLAAKDGTRPAEGAGAGTGGDMSTPWGWATSYRGAAITRAVVSRPAFLIDDLLSRAHQHAIIGASGSAKTWLEFALAIAVASPEVTRFLGQPVAVHGPVVIESWEQGTEEDLRRLQKLVRGHGLPVAPDTLILQSMPFLTLQDDGAYQARLRDLREAEVVLYVFDSLSEGAGIDLNDNTAYTTWWRTRVRPLLDLGITVVFTHLRGHLKPGTLGDHDAAFRGATQIRALCTAVIECRHLTATTSLLIHNKYRNTGQLPLGILTLTGGQDEPTITLDMHTLPDAAGKADRARLALLALARLHPAGITRKMIEDDLNAPSKAKAARMSRKTYNPALAALEADKTFEAFPQGNADAWRLVADPDEGQDD